MKQLSRVHSVAFGVELAPVKNCLVDASFSPVLVAATPSTRLPKSRSLRQSNTNNHNVP
jgi:hypothetical protein